MISISSCIVQKQICKKCHSKPIKIKKIGKIFTEYRDIDQIIKDSQKEHFIYILGAESVGNYLDYRNNNRVRLSTLNYSIRDFKVSASKYRKFKFFETGQVIKGSNILLSCKCGLSYWVIPNLDKNIFPELNRKSFKKVD